MRKYLAVLKDSLYETIDYKFFYFLVGLSVLITLFCFTFSFERQPADQMLARNLSGQTVSRYRFFGPQGSGSAGATVAAVKELPPRGDPRLAWYRFELRPGNSATFHLGLHETVKLHHEFQRMLSTPTGLHMNFSQQLMDFTRPGSTEEWVKLLEEYLLTFPGFETVGEVIVHGELRERTGGLAFGLDSSLESPASRDKREREAAVRFTAEVGLNWTQVYHGYERSYLLGLWTPSDQDRPLSHVLFGIQDLVVGWFIGWGTILIGLIVTAGFVPNMLQKGTVDLLLVKPISRPGLLLYKFLGGLTFIFLNALVLVSGTWVAFGITAGVWSPWYLSTIFVITGCFAVLYSLSTLLGVLTRSPLAAILVTIGFWFILFLVKMFYLQFQDERLAREAPGLKSFVDGVHTALPRLNDLSYLNNAAMLKANGMSESPNPFDLSALIGRGLRHEGTLSHVIWDIGGSSVIFIAVMLTLACWRFSVKDY